MSQVDLFLVSACPIDRFWMVTAQTHRKSNQTCDTNADKKTRGIEDEMSRCCTSSAMQKCLTCLKIQH